MNLNYSVFEEYPPLVFPTKGIMNGFAFHFISYNFFPRSWKPFILLHDEVFLQKLFLPVIRANMELIDSVCQESTLA